RNSGICPRRRCRCSQSWDGGCGSGSDWSGDSLRQAGAPSIMARRRVIYGILLVALAASPILSAGEGEGGSGRVLLQPPKQVVPSPINDRFAVRLLYYRPMVDNRLRYDHTNGTIGTSFDAEDLLGLKDSA